MQDERNGPGVGADATQTAERESHDPTPRLKTVLCQKCGKRMLIDVSAGSGTHRCPVCKAAFQIVCHAGEISVIFAPE